MPRYYEFRNPYDFVPLEDAVDRGYDAQPQDRISRELLTGIIRCQLHTETPLFIHGLGQQNKRERALYRDDGGPIIPATSLKGAVRSIVEIVANCCLSTLPKELVYRHTRRKVRLGNGLGQRVRNVETGEVYEEPAAYRPCTRRDNKCLCCALFGMVEEERKQGTAAPLAGRVYFGAGRPATGKCEERTVLFPEPRGGPHPDHRPFYFEDAGGGQILGRKLYYHHRDWQETLDRNVKLSRREPLRLEAYEGQFDFEVRFENLTEQELGVLLYALELESDLRHHVGFGKPFGLGTAKIALEPPKLMRFGADGDAAGPTRYLHYDLESLAGEKVWDNVPLGEGSPAEAWTGAVVDAWQERPGGEAALRKFRHILRWPTDESYQYPHFLWFRDVPEAKTMGLENYQRRAGGEEPLGPEPPKRPREDIGRQQGTIKWFSQEKGYGFIKRPQGKDVFVHHSDIRMEGYKSLEEGQTVAFDVEKRPKGLRAVNVDVVKEPTNE